MILVTIWPCMVYVPPPYRRTDCPEFRLQFSLAGPPEVALRKHFVFLFNNLSGGCIYCMFEKSLARKTLQNTKATSLWSISAYGQLGCLRLGCVSV